MSCASCWSGVRLSALAAPETERNAQSVVDSRSERIPFRCTAPSRFFPAIETANAPLCKRSSPAPSAYHAGLFRILHRDHLDLHQEAGIGKRGDAEHRARGQIGLAATE